MTRNETMPTKLMEMAEKSCLAANDLLKMGYLNDAASRAYYSMFYAAQALLLVSDAPVKPTIGKTHSGLINAFSEHIVNKGIVSKNMGKLLSIAHKSRLLTTTKPDQNMVKHVSENHAEKCQSRASLPPEIQEKSRAERCGEISRHSTNTHAAVVL